jgi:hypothetical protein
VQLLDALELSGTRLFPLEATGIKSLDFARHRRHENEYPYISFDIILRSGMSFCMPLLSELLMRGASARLCSMSETGGRSNRRSLRDRPSHAKWRHMIAIVMW